MLLLLSLKLMHVAVAAAYFVTAFCFSYIVLHLLLMVAMAHCCRRTILQLQIVAAGFQPLYGCCFLLPLPHQGDSACCNYLYCFQLVLVLDLYIECCLAGTTSCMSQVQQTSAAVIQASVQYN